MLRREFQHRGPGGGTLPASRKQHMHRHKQREQSTQQQQQQQQQQHHRHRRKHRHSDDDDDDDPDCGGVTLSKLLQQDTASGPGRWVATTVHQEPQPVVPVRSHERRCGGGGGGGGGGSLRCSDYFTLQQRQQQEYKLRKQGRRKTATGRKGAESGKDRYSLEGLGRRPADDDALAPRNCRNCCEDGMKTRSCSHRHRQGSECRSAERNQGSSESRRRENVARKKGKKKASSLHPAQKRGEEIEEAERLPSPVVSTRFVESASPATSMPREASRVARQMEERLSSLLCMAGKRFLLAVADDSLLRSLAYHIEGLGGFTDQGLVVDRGLYAVLTDLSFDPGLACWRLDTTDRSKVCSAVRRYRLELGTADRRAGRADRELDGCHNSPVSECRPESPHKRETRRSGRKAVQPAVEISTLPPSRGKVMLEAARKQQQQQQPQQPPPQQQQRQADAEKAQETSSTSSTLTATSTLTPTPTLTHEEWLAVLYVNHVESEKLKQAELLGLEVLDAGAFYQAKVKDQYRRVKGVAATISRRRRKRVYEVVRHDNTKIAIRVEHTSQRYAPCFKAFQEYPRDRLNFRLGSLPLNGFAPLSSDPNFPVLRRPLQFPSPGGHHPSPCSPYQAPDGQENSPGLSLLLGVEGRALAPPVFNRHLQKAALADTAFAANKGSLTEKRPSRDVDRNHAAKLCGSAPVTKDRREALPTNGARQPSSRRRLFADVLKEASPAEGKNASKGVLPPRRKARDFVDDQEQRPNLGHGDGGKISAPNPFPIVFPQGNPTNCKQSKENANTTPVYQRRGGHLFANVVSKYRRVKASFCEVCGHDYFILREHIEFTEHQECAADISRYRELDALLNAFPTIDTFLANLQRERQSERGSPISVANAAFITTSTVTSDASFVSGDGGIGNASLASCQVHRNSSQSSGSLDKRSSHEKETEYGQCDNSLSAKRNDSGFSKGAIPEADSVDRKTPEKVEITNRDKEEDTSRMEISYSVAESDENTEEVSPEAYAMFSLVSEDTKKTRTTPEQSSSIQHQAVANNVEKDSFWGPHLVPFCQVVANGDAVKCAEPQCQIARNNEANIIEVNNDCLIRYGYSPQDQLLENETVIAAEINNNTPKAPRPRSVMEQHRTNDAVSVSYQNSEVDASKISGQPRSFQIGGMRISESSENKEDIHDAHPFIPSGFVPLSDLQVQEKGSLAPKGQEQAFSFHLAHAEVSSKPTAMPTGMNAFLSDAGRMFDDDTDCNEETDSVYIPISAFTHSPDPRGSNSIGDNTTRDFSHQENNAIPVSVNSNFTADTPLINTLQSEAESNDTMSVNSKQTPESTTAKRLKFSEDSGHLAEYAARPLMSCRTEPDGKESILYTSQLPAISLSPECWKPEQFASDDSRVSQRSPAEETLCPSPSTSNIPEQDVIENVTRGTLTAGHRHRKSQTTAKSCHPPGHVGAIHDGEVRPPLLSHGTMDNTASKTLLQSDQTLHLHRKDSNDKGAGRGANYSCHTEYAADEFSKERTKPNRRSVEYQSTFEPVESKTIPKDVSDKAQRTFKPESHSVEVALLTQGSHRRPEGKSFSMAETENDGCGIKARLRSTRKDKQTPVSEGDADKESSQKGKFSKKLARLKKTLLDHFDHTPRKVSTKSREFGTKSPTVQTKLQVYKSSSNTDAETAGNQPTNTPSVPTPGGAPSEIVFQVCSEHSLDPTSSTSQLSRGATTALSTSTRQTELVDAMDSDGYALRRSTRIRNPTPQSTDRDAPKSATSVGPESKKQKRRKTELDNLDIAFQGFSTPDCEETGLRKPVRSSSRKCYKEQSSSDDDLFLQELDKSESDLQENRSAVKKQSDVHSSDRQASRERRTTGRRSESARETCHESSASGRSFIPKERRKIQRRLLKTLRDEASRQETSTDLPSYTSDNRPKVLPGSSYEEIKLGQEAESSRYFELTGERKPDDCSSISPKVGQNVGERETKSKQGLRLRETPDGKEAIPISCSPTSQIVDSSRDGDTFGQNATNAGTVLFPASFPPHYQVSASSGPLLAPSKFSFSLLRHPTFLPPSTARSEILGHTTNYPAEPCTELFGSSRSRADGRNERRARLGAGDVPQGEPRRRPKSYHSVSTQVSQEAGVGKPTTLSSNSALTAFPFTPDFAPGDEVFAFHQTRGFSHGPQHCPLTPLIVDGSRKVCHPVKSCIHGSIVVDEKLTAGCEPVKSGCDGDERLTQDGERHEAKISSAEKGESLGQGERDVKALRGHICHKPSWETKIKKTKKTKRKQSRHISDKDTREVTDLAGMLSNLCSIAEQSSGDTEAGGTSIVPAEKAEVAATTTTTTTSKTTNRGVTARDPSCV